MEEYNFHEVIALLQDDKDLIFKTENGCLVTIVDDLLSIFKNKDWMVYEITSKTLHAKFTILKLQVTPIKALQAYMNGKAIELTKFNKHSNKDKMKITSQMNNFEFNLDDLHNGKWRILD